MKLDNVDDKFLRALKRNGYQPCKKCGDIVSDFSQCEICHDYFCSKHITKFGVQKLTGLRNIRKYPLCHKCFELLEQEYKK